MKTARPSRLLAAALISLVLMTLQFRATGLLNPAPLDTTPLTGRQNASAAVQAAGSAPQAPTLERTIQADRQPLSSLGDAIRQPELLQKHTPPEVLSQGTFPSEAPTLSVAAARRITEAQMASPEFRSFIEGVIGGHEEEVRGVYVEGVLSLPVIQQPADNQSFVSTNRRSATQFHPAAQNGVIGLLAHNFLSGGLFYKLAPGQEVWIVYGDGSLKDYLVTEVAQFQKLTPDSLRSDLIDLATGQKLTTDQVFSRFYRGNHHVTFQTCLERNGLSNWGLTFVVAEPVE